MELINNLGRPVWAEINLSALSSNIRAFRNILPVNVRLMAVIKADGYGHGAYETAKIALKEKASMLGLPLEEGISLRQKASRLQCSFWATQNRVNIAPCWKRS